MQPFVSGSPVLDPLREAELRKRIDLCVGVFLQKLNLEAVFSRQCIMFGGVGLKGGKEVCGKTFLLAELHRLF